MRIIKEALNFITLSINSMIYFLVALAYRIFFLVTKVEIFDFNDPNTIGTISKRLYIVLGVVMLFILAYNIILYIINPDKLNGENSFKSMAKNAVISLAAVAMLPTVFDLMSNLQSDILTSNVIGNVILGSTSTSGNIDEDNAGDVVAVSIFSAFYHPIYKDNQGNTIHVTASDCKDDEEKKKNVGNLCNTYVSLIDDAENNGRITEFILNTELNEAAATGKMEYYWLLAGAAGLFAAYTIVSFALDVGARTIKLMVLQLIAPVPIMMRIIEPKGMFDRWLKSITKTYLMVFTRIATLYFSIFTMQLLANNGIGLWTPFKNTLSSYGSRWDLTILFADVIIKISIMHFAKTAPKLIEEVLGQAMKGTLSIRKKLNGEDYAYARRGAAALGTAARGIGRGAFNTFFQQNANGGYTFRGFGGPNGVGSAALQNVRRLPTRGLYGLYRGWQNGGGNLEQIGNAINTAANETEARVSQHERNRERNRQIRQNGAIRVGGNEYQVPILSGILGRVQGLADTLEHNGDEGTFGDEAVRSGVRNVLGNFFNPNQTMTAVASASSVQAGNINKVIGEVTSAANISKGVKDIEDRYRSEIAETRRQFSEENARIDRERIKIQNKLGLVNQNQREAVENYVRDTESIRSRLEHLNAITTGRELTERERATYDSISNRMQQLSGIINGGGTLTAEQQTEMQNLSSQIRPLNEILYGRQLTAQELAEQQTLNANLQTHNHNLELAINDQSVYNNVINQSNADALQSLSILNAEQEANNVFRTNEINRLEKAEKAEINNKKAENANNAKVNLHNWWRTNGAEFINQFNALPEDTRNQVLSAAGVTSIEELGQIIENENYTSNGTNTPNATDNNIITLKNFFGEMKKVESSGWRYRVAQFGNQGNGGGR